jgi:hypothetical protein
MFKELEIHAKDFKVGDCIEPFWRQFVDGSIVNGFTQILGVSFGVPEPSGEWKRRQTEKFLEDFEEFRKAGSLMLVTIKTNYYEPMDVVMFKEEPFLVFREKRGE